MTSTDCRHPATKHRKSQTLGDYTLAFLSAAVLGFVAAGFAMGITRLRLVTVPSAP
ncbi:MAG TPA: hypothetical protein VH702_20110 [Vicinamibacterales bacterium]|jgi:hypothetical protein